MKLVNWYWKRCDKHYLKDVYQWFYDEDKSSHVHVHVGVMCMDNFGNLVLCDT